MTPDEFRAAALSMPGAEEGEHMQHPDFRSAHDAFKNKQQPRFAGAPEPEGGE